MFKNSQESKRTLTIMVLVFISLDQNFIARGARRVRSTEGGALKLMGPIARSDYGRSVDRMSGLLSLFFLDRVILRQEKT